LRVLVCGGRDWHDVELVEGALNRIYAARGPFDRLIHGGARGVDRIAGKWARQNGVLEWDFLPEWHRAGTPDGSVRNQRMIAEAAPDLVVAFPGGLGTADMVERARAAGVEVIEPLGRSSSAPGS
jgi:YspA, cpYpsA-related SLOG family